MSWLDKYRKKTSSQTKSSGSYLDYYRKDANGISAYGEETRRREEEEERRIAEEGAALDRSLEMQDQEREIKAIPEDVKQKSEAGWIQSTKELSKRSFLQGVAGSAEGLELSGKTDQGRVSSSKSAIRLYGERPFSRLGKVKEFLGRNIGETAKKLEEKYVDESKINPYYSDTYVDQETGKLDKSRAIDPRILLTKGSQMVNQMGPGFAGGPVGVAVYMGGQIKADSYDDFSNRLAKQKGVPVEELSKEDLDIVNKYSSADAMIEGALEAIGAGYMLKKIPVFKLLRNTIFNKVFDASTRAIGEAETESVQSLARDVLSYIGKFDKNFNTTEAWKRMKSDFFEGLGGAGGMSIIGATKTTQKETTTPKKEPTEPQPQQSQEPRVELEKKIFVSILSGEDVTNQIKELSDTEKQSVVSSLETVYDKGTPETQANIKSAIDKLNGVDPEATNKGAKEVISAVVNNNDLEYIKEKSTEELVKAGQAMQKMKEEEQYKPIEKELDKGITAISEALTQKKEESQTNTIEPKKYTTELKIESREDMIANAENNWKLGLTNEEKMKQIKDSSSILVKLQSENVPVTETLKRIDRNDGYFHEGNVSVKKLASEYGNFNIIVKDVNGQRALVPVSEFLEWSESKAFRDRVKTVFINKNFLSNQKRTVQTDFMEGLKDDKITPARIGETKQIDIESIKKDLQGINLVNESTISTKSQVKFIEAITDKNIINALKENGVKEIRILPPHKFSLSEQGNISKTTKILRINADATNPKQTIQHEIAHLMWDNLDNIQQKQVEQILKDNNLGSGYLKNNRIEEAFVDNYFDNKVLQDFYKSQPLQEGGSLIEEARKYKSAEELSDYRRKVSYNSGFNDEYNIKLLKFVSGTRPTYKRHITGYKGDLFEFIRNNLGIPKEMKGAKVEIADIPEHTKNKLKRLKNRYDEFQKNEGVIEKSNIDYFKKRDLIDREREKLSKKYGVKDISDAWQAEKHAVINLAKYDKNSNTFTIFGKYWEDDAINNAISKYLKEKTGYSFIDYSKLPSRPPEIPKTKEEVFIDQLKIAQKNSDKAKDYDWDVSYEQRGKQAYERRELYKIKNNQVERAIVNSNKIGIKPIISIDKQAELPVVYFETPKGQVSFHIPQYLPIGEYVSTVAGLKKYLPKKIIENTKLVDDYEWSGLKNSEEIIDALKLEDFNKSQKATQKLGSPSIQPQNKSVGRQLTSTNSRNINSITDSKNLSNKSQPLQEGGKTLEKQLNEQVSGLKSIIDNNPAVESHNIWGSYGSKTNPKDADFVIKLKGKINDNADLVEQIKNYTRQFAPIENKGGMQNRLDITFLDNTGKAYVWDGIKVRYSPKFTKALSQPLQEGVKKAKPLQKQKNVKIATAIDGVKSIMSRKPELPILENVKVKNGKMYATNLDQAIVLDTELEDGIYRPIGKEFVVTELDMTDFPIVPTEKGTEKLVKIARDKIIDVFKKLSKFVSKDEYRQELLGVEIKLDGGEISFTATDAFQLFNKILKGKIFKKDNISVLVPDPAIISKATKSLEGNITVSIEKKKDNPMLIIFSGDNGYVVSRLTVGKYPNTSSLSYSFVRQLVIDRKELDSATKTLALIIKEIGSPAVSLDIKNGKLSLNVSGGRNKIKKTIELNVRENKIYNNSAKEGILVMPILGEEGSKQFVINNKFLQNAVRTLDSSDKIYLSLGKGTNEMMHFENKNVMDRTKTKTKEPIQDSKPSFIQEAKILRGTKGKTAGKQFELFAGFRKNQKTITAEEAIVRAKKIIKRLKITGIEYSVLKKILDSKGGEAIALSFANNLAFTDFVNEFASEHEIGHTVFRTLDRITSLKNKGVTKENITKEMRMFYPDIKDKGELEEKLMENLELYLQERQANKKTSATGKIGRFFEYIFSFIKNIFSNENQTKIRKFYKFIEKGKGKESINISKKPLPMKSLGVASFTGNDAKYIKETLSNEDLLKLLFKNVDDRARKIKLEAMATKPQARRDINKAIDVAGDMGVTTKDNLKKDINFITKIIGEGRDFYLSNKKDFIAAKTKDEVSTERSHKKEKLDREFATTLKPFLDLDNGERIKTGELLLDGDRKRTGYSELELKAEGLNKGQIDGYFAVRKAFDNALSVLAERMREAGIRENEIKAFIHDKKGYIPHKWQYKYVVKERVLQENGTYRTVSMLDYKTQAGARQAREVMVAEDIKKGLKGKQYELTTLDSIEPDFFTDQGMSFANMKAVIGKANAPAEMKGKIIEALRNMVKEKGFGRHFIRRTGVAGYEEAKTLPKVIADYFAGFSGFVTKMEAAPKYFKALEQADPRKQKKFYAWLKDSIAYEMTNTSDFNLAKSIAFTYYLANDLSFIAVNATQNFIMGIGELGKLPKGKWIAEIEMFKAILDWSTQQGISQDEKEAVKKMYEVGELGGDLAGELIGFKNNPLYRGISVGMNKALFHSTAFAERHINRTPAFLAARRIWEKSGFSGEELDAKALETSKDIHIRYGKQHRAEYLRGAKGILLIFTNYIREFLFQLYRDTKQKEFLSLTRKMFWTAFFGGATALPFAHLISSIISALAGDDDDDDLKKEASFLKTMLKKGVPATIGVDLSNRVAIDITALSGILDQPTNIIKYLGAAGSLVFTRIPKGYKYAKQGRYLESGSQLMPDFVGNVLKAYLGKTRGVRSEFGNLLTGEDKKPFKYTKGETIIKAIGFSPTREQNIYEEKSKKYKEDKKKDKKMEYYRTKIKIALDNNDYTEAYRLKREAKRKGLIGTTTEKPPADSSESRYNKFIRK